MLKEISINGVVKIFKVKAMKKLLILLIITTMYSCTNDVYKGEVRLYLESKEKKINIFDSTKVYVEVIVLNFTDEFVQYEIGDTILISTIQEFNTNTYDSKGNKIGHYTAWANLTIILIIIFWFFCLVKMDS